MKNNQPDYKVIYSDILYQDFPDKLEECHSFLEKEHLSAIDIIVLNKKIFGVNKDNQKHRSYSRSDISKILDYQNKHGLNNSRLANYFKLSRNTVAKWKKMFVV